MTVKECEEYLEELNTKGIKPGLDAMKELLKTLGEPDKSFKIIHIAGTNGKGSTGCFIANILKKAGYTVGHYSSPAVFSEREIVSVNGKNIPLKDYVNLIEEIKNTGLFFTRFELETALALLYFKRSACDYAVIECGLGGLMDATNAVSDTELSVFASIGKDHMSYLGDTIEKIAENKAGIIRKNGHVVYIKSNTASDDVLEKCAKAKSATIDVADPSDIDNASYSIGGPTFDYKDRKGLSLSMIGDFQPANAILAIKACDVLSRLGAKIDDKAINAGLKSSKLKGRFEAVSSYPTVVLDGAHNEPASKVLAKNIARFFEDKRLIFIIGVLKDKEYDKVIKNT